MAANPTATEVWADFDVGTRINLMSCERFWRDFESQIAPDTELSVQKGYLLMMLNRLYEAKAHY